jgi:hypothetical protein
MAREWLGKRSGVESPDCIDGILPDLRICRHLLLYVVVYWRVGGKVQVKSIVVADGGESKSKILTRRVAVTGEASASPASATGSFGSL